MDLNRVYEFAEPDDEPSLDSHPTPLLPLFYARRVWRTASRRVRHWLAIRFALDHVARYPVSFEDTEQPVLTGHTQRGKTLDDAVLALTGPGSTAPGTRTGSLRFHARYEAERLTTATRHRLRRLREQTSQFGRAAVKAVREHRQGGETE